MRIDAGMFANWAEVTTHRPRDRGHHLHLENREPLTNMGCLAAAPDPSPVPNRLGWA